MEMAEMTAETADPVLTVEEAAELLLVGTQTVRDWIQRGALIPLPYPTWSARPRRYEILLSEVDRVKREGIPRSRRAKSA